jgi:hypothetical protein
MIETLLIFGDWRSLPLLWTMALLRESSVQGQNNIQPKSGIARTYI